MSLDGHAESEEHPGGSQEQASVRPLMNTVMMPWFMSSSWVPKFTGEDDSLPFSKWHPKVRSYLRAQGLDHSQTADFVLDALEGKAHRQVMLLPPERRQSEETILAELTKL